MNKLISFLFIINIACFTSCGQTINKQKLSNFFDSLSEHNLAHGSIAVSRNGIVKYQKAIGYTQIGKEIKYPATIETKYRIGSVTKMFTAVIVFQLIEEGKLRLDDTLDQYNFNLSHAKHISLESLLYHRSGISNYSDASDYDEWKYKSLTKAELRKIIKKTTSDFKPGKKAEYSNSNFLLLSLIVEDICKKPFQQVLNERILSKIGLKNTYFENAADTLLMESKSYKYVDNTWIQQREDIAANHIGAGAIISTPTDLVLFIDALFSYRLISSNSLSKMTTTIDNYGMGVFPFTFDSHTAFGHEGRLNEFYTTLIHFPKEKLSVAYCTNGMVYPRDDIIQTTVKLCNNKQYELPDFNSMVLKEQDFDKLTGSYSSNIMPINVECKNDNGSLVVVTKGEEFSTSMIGENYFANYRFGYFFKFIPEKKELIIRETDNVYYLKKNE